MMLALLLVVLTLLVTVVYTLTNGGFGDFTFSASDVSNLLTDSFDTVLSSDIVGYIAYFFPLEGLYYLTEFFLTFVIVYTVIVNVYPIIRDFVVARAS